MLSVQSVSLNYSDGIWTKFQNVLGAGGGEQPLAAGACLGTREKPRGQGAIEDGCKGVPACLMAVLECLCFLQFASASELSSIHEHDT